VAFTPFVETDQPTMANFNEKFQECIREATEGGTEIFVGSYVGTGTYGESNPNTLTFPFKPKVWGVFCNVIDYTSQYGYKLISFDRIRNCLLIPWLEDGPYQIDSNGRPMTMNGATVSWYCTSADEQCNLSGYTYYYIAIGKGESA